MPAIDPTPVPAASASSAPWHPSLNLAAWQQAEQDPTVIVVNGADIRVNVRNGQLTLRDGPPGNSRIRQIPRIPRTVRRIVVLAGHGMFTIESQRWLNDAGIPWSILEKDGTCIAQSGPQSLDGRLLRAQSRACPGGDLESTGLEISRYLISEKIKAQIRVLSDHFGTTEIIARMQRFLEFVQSAVKFSEIQANEGHAASLYFECWQDRVFVPFSPRDLIKVPAHWRVFAQRQSFANEKLRNNNATDPVNSSLNYLYKIAETECVQACHATGLSPVLGVLHKDRENRDSLALDLLEVLRPACDRVALEIFGIDGEIPANPETGKPRYFDRRWVHETSEGIVRLDTPYTHRLAGQSARFAEILAPHVHHVAGILAKAATGTVTVKRATGIQRNPDAPREHRNYPKSRLRSGVGVNDLIPDSLWEVVEPMIPARKAFGRPSTRPLRELVAAPIARYILGAPWHQCPSLANKITLNRWHEIWVNDGTWPKVRKLAESSGHLTDLTE